MKIHKGISIWWDRTHGGEIRLHTDFIVGVDEGFAEALAELFKDFKLPKPEDRGGGGVKKVHLEMSIYEENQALKGK